MTPAINETKFHKPQPALCPHCNADLSVPSSILALWNITTGWIKGHATDTKTTYADAGHAGRTLRGNYASFLNLPHCATCLQPLTNLPYYAAPPEPMFADILPPKSADQTEVEFNPDLPEWRTCPECHANLNVDGIYMQREETWKYHATIHAPGVFECSDSMDTTQVGTPTFHCMTCHAELTMTNWEWY